MKVIRQKRNRGNKLLITIVISSVILLILAFLAFFFFEDIVNIFDKNSSKTQDTDKVVSIEIDTESDSYDIDSEELKIPELEYDENEKGFFGDDNNKIYVFDKVAYEVFYGTDATVKSYIDAVNNGYKALKKKLGDNIKVYDMIVPTRVEFTLPDKLKIKAYTNSQSKNISYVYENLNKNIITMDVCENLMMHRDEYIFYNTERFWTQLGSYYGYEKFTELADIEKYSLEELKENTNSVEKYLGSLAKNIKESKSNKAYKVISKNPDTVDYYTIPKTCSVKITNSDKETFDAGLYYPNPSKYYAYALFLWDNNPLTVIKTENKTGRKLLVVKDDSANTMIPLLTSGYDEIYVIDYRYYDGNVVDLCKKHKIKEVAFINGIMPANTQYLVGFMKDLFK